MNVFREKFFLDKLLCALCWHNTLKRIYACVYKGNILKRKGEDFSIKQFASKSEVIYITVQQDFSHCVVMVHMTRV